MAGEISIKLSDIKCKEIVDKIQECTNIISKFTNVLNKHLENEELIPPQICIIRSNVGVYKDDGNTPTCGYQYDVYWLFPYINVKRFVNINGFRYSDSYMWPGYLLFFKLTITESVIDNKYVRGYYLKIYVTGENYKKNNNPLVKCYNENYGLSLILNPEDMYLCIKKINEEYSKFLLKQTLCEELSKEGDIPDIKGYINKNTRL